MDQAETILQALGARSLAEAKRKLALDLGDNPYCSETCAKLAVVLTLPDRRPLGGIPVAPLEPQPRRGYNGQRTTDHATAETWRRAAAFAASDPNVGVLILGESGTGKEGVARLVHGDKSTPFLAVNCGGFTDTLIESELFGYERGAFTGATQQRAGVLEAANGGTVFLDEVGELPASAQVRLLRVLQERQFRRVGGTQNVPFKARIIAATHRNLRAEVRAGRFREDLYYRLAVLILATRPLRMRRGDILMLAESWAQPCTLTDDARHALTRHEWPGNVRELENTMVRAKVLAASVDRTIIQVHDLELSAD